MDFHLETPIIKEDNIAFYFAFGFVLTSRPYGRILQIQKYKFYCTIKCNWSLENT